MSEVNGPNINLNQLNYAGLHKQNIEQPVPETTTEAAPQITDFSDSKAEALGRSMLFKGADSTNNDLKSLIENPQIAENSDKLFDAAYESALKNGVENPYEEAASAATTSM
jgi:hypothetical protein